MSVALNIYHKLPPRTRTIVASMRGYYLNWWRYDSNTQRLVDEALERDYWSSSDWEDWRAERLSELLLRATREVPYYRAMWDDRRRGGDTSDPAILENWPILEKQAVRERGPHLIARGCDPARMFRDHTSGTTGTSLDIWLTRTAVREWYALFEARCRRWYGHSRHDRWAMIGGQLITPVSQKSPPFWIWNSGLNQLYMSSYHLSPESVPAYLDAIAKYRVKYILGYPSAIHALALTALKAKRSNLPIETVVTNAEPVYAHQREAIEQAFSCPVRETYGMAEIVAAASECERGGLHQWPDVGITRLIKSDANGRGEMVCTGLLNIDMPLINYRVGDSARFSDAACSCGRTLPLLKEITGRTDDVLYTRDGKMVGRLDPVFKGTSGIYEAQLIQVALDRMKVRYVRDAGFDAATLVELASRIRERMGDIRVEFDEVPAVPRGQRGKFRAVVCELSASERAEMRQ